MDRCSRAFEFTIEAPDEGKRLDLLICAHAPGCARTLSAKLIRSGSVHVDGHVKKAGYRVRMGEKVSGIIPLPVPASFEPEPIALSVLYEDTTIIVINKQPGIVVHPAPGHRNGTLVNAILHHCPGIEAIGGEIRPGIVHRLDRDTSGTLVIAKNAVAMKHLADQFRDRHVQKEYLALVWGCVARDCGTISLPIGRHPVDRKRMSTVSRKTRIAETHWQVESRFDQVSLLRVRIRTGRTHQIRVHCAAMHHPVIGDSVYGGRNLGAKYPPASPAVRAAIESIGRQMLHAWRLGFTHPVSGKEMMFESPLPSDMTFLLETLRSTPDPAKLLTHSEKM
jgi:23S rRNA pseudouridine1911/1915/1917 synthase